MKLKDQIVAGLQGIIGQALIRSLRIEVVGLENYDSLKQDGTPAIFVMWHSRLLLFFRHAAKLQVSTLVSPSRDGEIGARIAGRLGINMVRGNDNNHRIASAKALRQLLNQGADIGIFADGPLGPAQRLKPGIVSLARYAKKSQILPAGADAGWKITFRGSWDNFILPLPFSRVVISFGEPVNIPLAFDKQNTQETINAIEQQITDLNSRSTALLHPQRKAVRTGGK